MCKEATEGIYLREIKLFTDIVKTIFFYSSQNDFKRTMLNFSGHENH